ncbi:response regulator [uncultured Desulfuromonas sp.]|uniref:response regulator n=1 Tax=uncultured Desulfuromonas sp. TaxID=181013 RepID=UPI00262BB490|nr:response regulator [uncultured Desulfuromonas sp.]
MAVKKDPRRAGESLGLAHSLQTRMIAGFSLLFVLIFCGVQYASIFGIPFADYQGRMGSRKAEAAKKLELIADTKKGRLQQWIKARRADTHIIAKNELVEEHVARLQERVKALRAAGETGAELWRQATGSTGYAFLDRYLQSVKTERGDYASIEIADAQSGTLLFSTDPARLGENIASSAEFAGALRSGDDYLGAPHLDPGGDDLCSDLCFSHVVTAPGGTAGAVVVLEAEIDASLTAMLHTGDGLGESGEALLVDGKRRVVTALKYHLPDGSSARPLAHRIDAEPAVRAARGEDGVIEAKDYRGIEVLAAYRHIPVGTDWGWGMVVKIDREELFAPLQEDIIHSMTLVLLGIILVVIVTIFMAGNLVLPLEVLANAAGGLAKGDLSIRCGLKRRDEIGVLSEAFDAMAGTLQETMGGLEQRSGQLQEAAESLEARQRVQQGALTVASVLASVATLDALLEQGLDKVMDATRSQVGAVYLRDAGTPDTLRLAKAKGLAPGTGLPAEIAMGQGPGLAAQRQTVEVLREIPPGTRFTVTTVAGEGLPNCIVNIPLVFQGRSIGVVALASLYPVTAEQLEVVEMTRPQLATAVSNALVHAETEKLASDLQEKNEELATMNEELQSQAEELQGQAEELTSQAVEMEAQRARVEEADRLKTEFLSNMSHELRTPLNSVLALSQLMLSRGVGTSPEQETEFLQVIERNGRHLLNLINDILDLSKIEAGRMDLLLSEFEPRQVVLDVAETVRPLCEKKGLELTLETGDLSLIRSDQDRVRQILLNLLSNAVKFTERGEVSVRVSVAAGRVSFLVRDTGTGISPADLEHIFDEFRQVDGSTTRRHEGTGLGLAICRKLARLLGGDIAVRSEVGQGSLFTLSLPIPEASSVRSEGSVRPEPARALSPAQEKIPAAGLLSPGPSGPGREKPLVLVVEDNPVATLQIRSVLEEAGYAVKAAAGGEEGLALVRTDVPDLIVLDLMMPGVDGFEVLERVRSTPRTATLPVLVLTAKELTAEDRARLSHNNVQQLIQKGSLDREQLIARVKETLRESREQTPAEPPAVDPSRPAGGGRGPVLVVEDNPDNRLTVEAILREMGRVCTSTPDGARALEMAREVAPSLILMDIHLPGLNGIDATRRIKSDPALKGIPVVALTARAMRGDRETLLAAGCDDYLSKPLERDALESILDRWAPLPAEGG